MKFGYRKPSLKKSLKARTTGRAKRSIKRKVNPMYGKKGTGWIRNPKKAAYNKVYNKTTRSVFNKRRRSQTQGCGCLLFLITVMMMGLLVVIIW